MDRLVGNYPHSSGFRHQASTTLVVWWSESQLEHSTSSTLTSTVIVACKKSTVQRKHGALPGLLATSTTHPRRRSDVHRLFRRRSNPSPSPRSTLRRKYSSWSRRLAVDGPWTVTMAAARGGCPVWQFIVHVNLVLMDASQHQKHCRAVLCRSRATDFLPSSRVHQPVLGRRGTFLWSVGRTFCYLTGRDRTEDAMSVACRGRAWPCPLVVLNLLFL